MGILHCSLEHEKVYKKVVQEIQIKLRIVSIRRKNNTPAFNKFSNKHNGPIVPMERRTYN
jgi:hypothetical protein